FGPASSHLKVGVSPSDVALVTLGDGPGPDIVVTDQESGEIYVLKNAEGAPFSTQLVFPAGTGLYKVSRREDTSKVRSKENPIALGAGAFAGATPDLVVLNSGSAHFALLAGDGQGGVFNPVTSPNYRTGTAPTAMVAADFDGDGFPDLAILDAG